MLSNLLEKLKIVLKNRSTEFTEEQINALGEILSLYIGGIIPIAVVRRELKLTNDETQKLMIYLETKGFLKSKYKVYCPDRSSCVKEKIYDDIRDIPKRQCDKCENECSYIENIAVVFEVISND